MTSRPSFDDIIAGLTEKALTEAQLASLAPADRMIALVSSISGLGAERTPEGMLELYLDVVCPERKTLTANVYRDVNYWRTASGCALVGRSLLRRFGVRSAVVGLEAPNTPRAYIVGRAVSDVVQAGIDQKAWVTDQVNPPPGSLVVIGTGLATHVTVLVSPVGEGGTYQCVDGGQVASAEGQLQLQCILPKTRQITRSAGKLYHAGRVQIGFVDPDKLQPQMPPTMDLV